MIFYCTGKAVTLRDISNIQSQLKKDGCSSNNIEDVVTKLKEDPLVTIEIFTDDEYNLMGIFHQDEVMKKIYSAFPEMLFVDATHKVNELRMPLYIFLICDGNGQSEIVASCLVSSEQRVVIEKMVNTFKKHNSTYCLTRVIMTDKDMNERDVLSEAFPNATLQLCLFHVLRTFGREITVEAMSIRSAEHSVALDILQKIAYSSSVETYEANRKLLNDTGFTKVLEYFEANWHPIRHEWVTCFATNFNFNTRTNNRLESINQKIKSVCSAFSNLEAFFKDFRTVVACLRIERDNKALECVSKISVFSIGTSAEAQYSRLLTPYAAKFVREQLEKRTKVKMVDGKVTTAETSLDACSCKFHQTMKLPCKHIFAFRENSHQPLFEERMAHSRWRLDFYKNSYEVFNVAAERGSGNDQASVVVSTNTIHQPNPKTQHQKYNAAHILALRLATVISETGDKEYNNKMNILKKVLQHWENGMSVCVIAKEITTSDEFIEEFECEDSLDDFPEETASSHGDESDISLENGSDAARDEDDSINSLALEATEIMESSFQVQEVVVDVTENLDEEPIDDDNYREAATLATQDEKNKENNSALSLIKLPPKMRKRGRPKGLANTVIGLPRKKAKDVPVAFEKLLPQQREKIILSWFAGMNAAEAAIKGKVITEDVVETIPENVSNACIDECVCMQSVKRFFTNNAWKTVEAILAIKWEGCHYYCTVCELEIDDDQDESINCSSCLGWMHFKCTGLKSSPKRKYWFCRACSKTSITA